MKDHNPPKSIISRRKFLTTLGIAATASTLSPGLPFSKSKKSPINQPGLINNPVSGKNLLKIGVLLPASNIYPAMSENLIAGINLYFDQIGNQTAGHEIVLLPAPIGFGPRSALSRARSLIELENADIVTGIVDMSVNQDLGQLFRDQRCFLIANQLGANLIDPEDINPFVVHNSLDIWKANWVLGQWAARNIGKKAFVVSSFYESGYEALYAFNLGYEQAGGEVVQTMVSHLPTDDKNLRSVLQSIDKSKSDLVFAAYSGEEAVEFVQAYHQTRLDHQLPLLGSPFMVDEIQLSHLGSAALGIKSCFPWSASLNQKVNRIFYNKFKQKYGSLPDSFAVLGFETAQLIANAVDGVQGDLQNTKAFRNHLINSKLISPRGRLKHNVTNQSISSPFYLREVRTHGVSFKNDIFETIEAFDNQDMITYNSDSDMRTGWLNPYLCV